MWGNKRGWIFSSVIIFVTVAGLWMLFLAGQPTPPSWDAAKQAKFLAAIDPPNFFDPNKQDLVPMPTKPGDSGNAYRKAIADFQAHKDDYLQFVPSKKDEELEGFRDLLNGAEFSGMTLLGDHPEEYVGFDEKGMAPLTALKHVAQAMESRAMFMIKNDKLDEAKKYLEADFILGVKLWNERVVWDELFVGSGRMSAGAVGLRIIADHQKEKDTKRITELQAFDGARQKYMTDMILPLWTMTHNLEPSDAGNLFLLAQKASEPMWRVEAIRQLARLRWNAGSSLPSDQHHAVWVLRKLAAKDPNPVIRSIADKASTVTLEELQQEVKDFSQSQ